MACGQGAVNLACGQGAVKLACGQGALGLARGPGAGREAQRDAAAARPEYRVGAALPQVTREPPLALQSLCEIPGRERGLQSPHRPPARWPAPALEARYTTPSRACTCSTLFTSASAGAMGKLAAAHTATISIGKMSNAQNQEQFQSFAIIHFALMSFPASFAITATE